LVPRLVLSTSEEPCLPLRWIAILYRHVDASLAATTGVHTGLDAAKVLLAGADVAMMTSALLRHGPSTSARWNGSCSASSPSAATPRSPSCVGA
jgi:dihydroorotate dehydrogenase (fumarate)